MVRQPRYRTTTAIAGLVVWLLASAPLPAQVEVDLSTRSLAVGEELTYVIRLDYEEPDDVVVPDVEVAGLRFVEGPNIRPVLQTGFTERSRQVEIRLGFVAERPGRYVIEPIQLDVAGQIFETPPKLVEIGERGARERVPFLARWRVPDAPLYAGEGRAVYLEIYNVDDYIYPSDVTVQPPSGAIFEEVQGLGKIGQRTVDGVTLFDIPVAVFMVTPSAPGEVQLEAARVEWEGLSATAPPATMIALSPPESIDSSGAVGSFVLAAELSQRTIAATETTLLTLRLEGTGNLHFLQMPSLELNGFRIEGDEAERRLTPVVRGYDGYRKVSYELRPTGSGTGTISVEPFPYLEWSTGRVVRTQLPDFVVEVTPVKEPVTDEGPAVPFNLLSAEEIASLEPANLYHNPLSYGMLAPGLLFLVFRRLWKRHGAAGSVLLVFMALFLSAAADHLPWTEINRALELYANGDPESALHEFESASREAPDSPGINLNLAILYFQQGDMGRSVYSAREALRLNPNSRTIRETQELIERGAGLERSVPPKQIVHPDTIFFALVGVVNLFFVALSFGLSRRKGIVVIGTILLGVMVLSLAVGLGLAVKANNDQLAVVLEPLSLRRIPSESAESWLDLPVGTAVEPIGEEGGYVLVRTDLGLEGWAPQSHMLWLENPVLPLLRYQTPGM